MPTARVLGVVALVVSAATGGCRYLQDSLLYHPVPRGGALPLPPAGYAIEPLSLAPATGIELEGWLVKPAGARLPLLVYFGGNAEEASWLIASADRFGGRALALVNYRGYGKSTGQPSEAALFADALAIHDALAARADVDAARIAVMGRSLGSGVAVHVAARRAIDRVVLVSPYDSVAAVGAAHFPSALVRIALRDRYDSAALAPAIHVPLLAIAGARDDIIPVAHSRRLYDLWGGDKRWLELPRAGHNDLQQFDEYWAAIAAFVAP
jgi:pimeloyl-ACP methyl ester carboxylesterase